MELHLRVKFCTVPTIQKRVAMFSTLYFLRLDSRVVSSVFIKTKAKVKANITNFKYSLKYNTDDRTNVKIERKYICFLKDGNLKFIEVSRLIRVPVLEVMYRYTILLLHKVNDTK